MIGRGTLGVFRFLCVLVGATDMRVSVHQSGAMMMPVGVDEVRAMEQRLVVENFVW